MPIRVTPVVPSTITVHLGLPDEEAENITVSFPDYVKNVASSEIYPTWEPAAIEANILAIVSFALNRVYTEFYPSRGYDFDITSTTAYDQKFIRGRNIFENISRAVDETFNDYIRRTDFVEPLAAKFCNGTTSTCDGLSQWGSQDLAQQGYGPMEILRYYYGEDIELVQDAPIQDLGRSYPGTPLRLGSQGENVVVVKTMLNRISQSYPAIPKIWPVTRVYDPQTEEAVRTFQRIFGLAADGVVGKATWYKMVYLYVGITQLAELVSEGQLFQTFSFQYPGLLRQGDRGGDVAVLQYMLALVAEFEPTVSAIRIDGVYGSDTARAVREYQAHVGLPPTGSWDLRLGIPSMGSSPALSGTCAGTGSTFRKMKAFRRRRSGMGPPAGPDSSRGRTSGWEAAIREEWNGMTPQELEEEMLSNPVQNLQYMLRRLGTRYSFLPQLATDGLFGEETLEAVMLFQRELAPPVTGVVDGRTWDAIRREWMALEREVAPPRSLRIFPGEGAQMLPGGEEEYMVLPQTMFQLLRQRLEGIVEDEANGQHGDASVQNTLWLQNLAQLEETGVMDRATWDMLSRLYELFITAGSGSGTAAHQNLT